MGMKAGRARALEDRPVHTGTREARGLTGWWWRGGVEAWAEVGAHRRPGPGLGRGRGGKSRPEAWGGGSREGLRSGGGGFAGRKAR